MGQRVDVPLFSQVEQWEVVLLSSLKLLYLVVPLFVPEVRREVVRPFGLEDALVQPISQKTVCDLTFFFTLPSIFQIAPKELQHTWHLHAHVARFS